MLLVDTNVLLYATDERSEAHARAHGWLEAALGGQEPVGFAWLAIVGFLRLSTQALTFPSPLTPELATGVVEAWLAAPAATVVHPNERHLPVLAGLLWQTGTGGNLTNDAHLAALAVEHGAEVISFDRDFERFEGVRWRMPTTPGA